MNALYRLGSQFQRVFGSSAGLGRRDVHDKPARLGFRPAMVHIILAAEAEFGVRFSTDEVGGGSPESPTS